MRRHSIVGLVLFALAFTACQPAQYQGLAGATQNAPNITPGPLTNKVQYWDLGLSIKYPSNWEQPQFLASQMTLAQSMQAAQGRSVTEPVVALSTRNDSQLGLSKDATLQDIAAAISTGPGVTLSNQRTTSLAGLDAAFLDLKDDTNKLYGAVFAFRLPDGRLGSLISVAPFSEWADFAPTLDAMQQSVTLLKPSDFKVPASGGSTATFPAGGLTFSLPEGWVSKSLGKNGTTLYRSSTDTDYLDNSGFANGPQLVIIGQTLAQGQSIRSAMTAMIAGQSGDKITDIQVGDQVGTQILSSDAATGQVVNFIGVTSQDKRVLMVLRWTTPGNLSDVTLPMLGSILGSAKFGAITSPIALPAAPVGTQAATH